MGSCRRPGDAWLGGAPARRQAEIALMNQSI
jgi:hypothetical protein